MSRHGGVLLVVTLRTYLIDMVWHKRNQTEEVHEERAALLKEIGKLSKDRLALQKALGAVEERFQVIKARVLLLRTGAELDE